MKDYVELIKKGVFYYAYLDDAIILGYLLKYKIKNKTVCFPETSLFKVLEELEKKQISFDILGKKSMFLKKSRNHYFRVKQQAYGEYQKNKIKNELLEILEKKSIKELEEMLVNLK